MVAETSYKSARGFIILRLGDGLSFFTKDNSANFLVKKKCNEALPGVYNFENTRKNFKSRTRSCSRPRI